MKTKATLSKRLKVLLGVLFFSGGLGLFVAQVTPGVPASSVAAAPPVSTIQPYRELSPRPNDPAISFIDSPSPTCYQPVERTGDCYIRWSYLNVSAQSGSSIISMTVTIDNRLRAYHSGFFQSSMLIPGSMIDPGFRVSCGAPGSGGDPEWGKIYSYVIRARESSGLSSANVGSVKCPANEANLFAPVIRKR